MKIGQDVYVLKEGRWIPAQVLRIGRGRVQVRVETKGDPWIRWVPKAEVAIQSVLF